MCIAVTAAPNIIFIDKTIDGRYYYKGYEITLIDEILKDLNSTADYNIQLVKTEHGMMVKNRTTAESLELVYLFPNSFKLDFQIFE